MKISQFVVSVIGVLYSMTLNNWIVLVLFGACAFISFRRVMKELEEGGEKSNDKRRK